MIVGVKTKVDQAAPQLLNEGRQGYPAMNKWGVVWTGDWALRLILAGKVFSLDLGAAETPLAGNHDADPDQPEFIIGVDGGVLIPISMNIAASGDADASADSIEVQVVADRTAAEAANAAATEETALNLLDGSDSFGGRCYSIVTSNVTAPVEADVLYTKIAKNIITTTGVSTMSVNAHYKWDEPKFLRGPCQILGYVVGVGDAQVTSFMGNFVFAHVPASWVPLR